MYRSILLLLAVTACTSSEKESDVPESSLSDDLDQDGYGADSDCNDDDASVHPGAPESCNAIDDNCDGQTDENPVNASTFYADGDADGYGAGDGTTACEAPSGYVTNNTDCNDDDAAFHPGAVEACDDPNDYNCDGSVAYADADSDGVAACNDCDDTSNAAYPGATEICDGEDNDCNGTVDDSLTGTSTWYIDNDGDGYGDAETTVEACAAPAGYVGNADDCNDSDVRFNPGATESDCSDPNDYNCDGSVGYEDGDGDGFAACEECDDANTAINPSAVEVCDQVDNNCDGQVDETLNGAGTWYLDGDGDGYGDPAVSVEACEVPVGYVATGDDCNDADTAYNPGVVETDCADPNDYNCDGSVGYVDGDNDGYAACEECNDSDAAVNPLAQEACDGVDNNCDGVIDEAGALGEATWYQDGDGDSFGNAASTMMACNQPSGYVADQSDCDDTQNLIFPGADEYCDGIDNNCDSAIDEDSAIDTASWYFDSDGDGFGDASVVMAACNQPSGYVALGTDCDDTEVTTYPGADEYCDGVDNSCDGVIDEDAAVDALPWYADIDSDNYGDPNNIYSSCSQPSGYLSDASDCDDTRNTINPAITELCDGVDNNCDGAIDEDSAADAVTWYQDADTDGYGNASMVLVSCNQPVGYLSDDTDCDDTSIAVYPGATELCNGIDDNCDGTTDEDSAADAGTWYQDSDGDSYGNSAVSMQACAQPSGYVGNGTDCNDAAVAVNPGATELCNSLDDDCDGSTDESDAQDAASWYVDLDGDTYGDSLGITRACSQPSGYVANATDCDDSNGDINPGEVEICDSSNTDEDCDGLSDDNDTGATGKSTWYRDSDGDTYGNASVTTQACDLPTGYVANSTDCNDNRAAINPAAQETCDPLDTDEDCDGTVDDFDTSVLSSSKSTWYRDVDVDGYGNLSVTRLACNQPSGYVANSTDCNDANANISPGDPEICDSSNTDEDCDGVADNNDASAAAAGKTTYYLDSDSDTYGSTTSAAFCDLPSGYSANNTDCNDSVAAINPGATEICDSSNTDEDCDGAADNNDSSAAAAGKTTYYLDSDSDTYGSTTSATFCDLPSGYSANNTDCNDSLAAINPGAQEICDAANTDEDCDGQADNNDSSAASAGKTTFYRDADTDTYGSSSVTTSACDLPSGYVTNSTDCNDASAAINPGAQEICDASNTDEDCDGTADNNDASAASAGKSTWYLDADNDTYGSATSTTQACDLPTGYVANSTDCNDGNGSISPAATEICDSSNTDEDCDGNADDADSSVLSSSKQTFYRDADTDTYGDPLVTTQACDLPGGYVTNNFDCDDTNSGITPTTTWYDDDDSDGYGNAALFVQACGQPAGYVLDATDCDDTNTNVNPGEAEICDAANTDEDCDGYADDTDTSPLGRSTWYQDADLDLYGTSLITTQACDQPAGYLSTSGDCNDANSGINPGATEVCDSSDTDEDCDGQADDNDASATGQSTWYRDADTDTYGTSGTTTSACNQPSGYVASSTDCNDSSSSINPGATEVCENNVDENCTPNECRDHGTNYDTSANTTFTGISTGTSGSTAGALGGSIAGGKDINGDGHADIIIGDRLFDATTGAADSNRGRAFILRGSASGVTDTIASPMATISSTASGDRAGQGVALINDNDADGDDEFAVGIYMNDTGATNAGIVYLFDGGSSLTGALGLGTATATLTGNTATELAGWAIEDVGDVTGDGVGDWAVGSPGANSAIGRVSILSGAATGAQTAGTISAGLLASVAGTTANDRVGQMICDDIDTDGDGDSDLVIGSTVVGTGNGSIWIYNTAVSGSITTTSATYTISALPYTGMTLTADTSFADWLGNGGDVNGDGYEDLLVGADGNDSGTTTDVGAMFLYYGPIGSNMTPNDADVTALGVAANDNTGRSVAGNMDVDNDGYGDILLGSPGFDVVSNGGGAILIYGTGSLSGTISLASSGAAYVGTTASAFFGQTVAGVGSVDGDAYDDFLIAAPQSVTSSTTKYGKAYLYYGSGE